MAWRTKLIYAKFLKKIKAMPKNCSLHMLRRDNNYKLVCWHCGRRPSCIAITQYKYVCVQNLITTLYFEQFTMFVHDTDIMWLGVCETSLNVAMAAKRQ